MGRLTKEQVLRDEKTNDPASIISLSLSHKALSDVSCLAEFKNLERLDLAFNNLTSLQGLNSCINLKWLSVVQNKLQTLDGIQQLTNLTVFNGGKNKLRSMEEVKPLVNLRALILNDNEIVSIRGLDDMKDLNTLVLSRNPISVIDNSIVNLKSLTKFSASNCQIQAIGSSFKCCNELKELRLTHNDIKVLPTELSYNKRLQNLDLGNNLITRWSELKALDSLVNLKNLNIQGNPIAEKDKLANKVKRLLPNLHIFNSRPIDKCIKSKEGEIVEIASHATAYKEDVNDDSNAEKELKRKRKKGNKLPTEASVDEEDIIVEKEEKKKKAKGEQENLSRLDVEKKTAQKGRKTSDKLSKKEGSVVEDGNTGAEKPKKKKLEKRTELDIIDDAGASFTELFATDVADPIEEGKRRIIDRGGQDAKLSGGLVTYPVTKKKSKHALSELQLTPSVEVGMGGASTWDGE